MPARIWFQHGTGFLCLALAAFAPAPADTKFLIVGMGWIVIGQISLAIGGARK